jgi:hypothetical protein
VERVVDVLAVGSAHVGVDEVAVPGDCTDGFGEAFYARPEAFLDARVRAFTSGLVLTDQVAVRRGLARLEKDLASGAWDREHGHLRVQPERKGALRLVCARARRTA